MLCRMKQNINSHAQVTIYEKKTHKSFNQEQTVISEIEGESCNKKRIKSISSYTHINFT